MYRPHSTHGWYCACCVDLRFSVTSADLFSCRAARQTDSSQSYSVYAYRFASLHDDIYLCKGRAHYELVPVTRCILPSPHSRIKPISSHVVSWHTTKSSCLPKLMVSAGLAQLSLTLVTQCAPTTLIPFTNIYPSSSPFWLPGLNVVFQPARVILMRLKQ